VRPEIAVKAAQCSGQLFITRSTTYGDQEENGSQGGFPQEGCGETEERIQKECETRERTSSRRAARERRSQEGRTQGHSQVRTQGDEKDRAEICEARRQSLVCKAPCEA
jgi:hypothetical protein